MMGTLTNGAAIGLAMLVAAACAAPEEKLSEPTAERTATASAEGEWVSIFDGETLDGWTPKIAGYPLGENFGDTFRVEDGIIKARFDQYGDEFAHRYGLLVYETPFEHYRLRLEYRFTGEQWPGAEDWAELNSGVIYHIQPLETIPQDAGFPVALEAQFLAEGAHAPTTGNMCSLETSVVVRNERPDDHCILSDIAARPKDQWVRFELEAAPGGIFRHYIDGELAFEFSEAIFDVPQDWADGMSVDRGFFALQSESHPVDFRNIELMVLED